MIDNIEIANIIEGVGVAVIKWLLIVGLSFIGTQIWGYIKLKNKVSTLSNDVRNVSIAVKHLKEKIGEENVQKILEDSELKQRVSKIEGMLLPKPKNGHA